MKYIYVYTYIFLFLSQTLMQAAFLVSENRHSPQPLKIGLEQDTVRHLDSIRSRNC